MADNNQARRVDRTAARQRRHERDARERSTRSPAPAPETPRAAAPLRLPIRQNSASPGPSGPRQGTAIPGPPNSRQNSASPSDGVGRGGPLRTPPGGRYFPGDGFRSRSSSPLTTTTTANNLDPALEGRRGQSRQAGRARDQSGKQSSSRDRTTPMNGHTNGYANGNGRDEQNGNYRGGTQGGGTIV